MSTLFIKYFNISIVDCPQRLKKKRLLNLSSRDTINDTLLIKLLFY